MELSRKIPKTTIKNPFRDDSGQPIAQFKLEAKAWDMCLDSIKAQSIYIIGDTSQTGIPSIAIKLRELGISGWLVFIED